MRDRRSRKYYDDRFDFRKNVVDWDYHMRVEAAGAGVIHFKHFLQWRLAGVGYPVREATYPAPNRTLVGYAAGRTKEFKDRNGEDNGRSVASRGFWGDILNSPYHAYGTMAEEPSLFKVANRQHVKNAVEVSDFNVAANLFEMRAGVPWTSRLAGGGADQAGCSLTTCTRPTLNLVPLLRASV
jgi:dynein assembly factor 3